ncbi:hypothetical protein [Halalkalibacterium halodurans]|uniref:BH1853 protein n=1 Tax=Halalkalibacterium halodurans (strain ATCC BAA-125 / DSM 18197 / FERM 7344 / JCM 9153 / C-125) TaxID=272558 RepID=Q9KBS2_HALH5|nr:hypothetical protein [Halalkalibacterium halodurans]MDY7222413.1 hypothetical protein [Halalkalibacterium halodurans]MDY7241634.1 hypothetical protein [Halalkalibacterium halodurans]MED4171794.1 hypothetical protein [Halalkalibacterium halodurans]BAB05572.1 BH1853 [Halalkalibacterium halodurans C-125]
MKRQAIMIAALLFSVIVGACSEIDDVTHLYKQESPIDIEMNIPDPLVTDQEESLTVSLSHNGEILSKVDSLHVHIWKHDHTVAYHFEQLETDQDGAFNLPLTFESDGLYYMKVDVTHNGDTIMPTAQLIVGELTDEEWNILHNQRESHDQDHGDDSHH